MRLPSLIRTTAFRLSLLFLGLFAIVAAALLFYVYFAIAGEVSWRADEEVTLEMASL